MEKKFQTVRGMHDLLPEEAAKKQYIEDVFRREAEAYGFESIDTPVLEDFNLLAAKGGAGEAIKEEIYYFKDKSGRELGLRFDFTVSLARFVANNPQLSKPFKRYQIGKVYRYDRPGEKRYREFTQADIDIVGSSSVLADYECITLAYKVGKDLGLDFEIRISNKKMLEELCLSCKVKKEQLKECLRSLDKMEKIGVEGVKKELKEKKIETKIVEVVKENNIEKIEKIVKVEGVKEVKELFEYCEKAGMKEFVKFDASLARGLEYYTGNVFEIKVKGSPSIGGGGRYDSLIELYGGQKTPAVGISFGIDRIIDLLKEEKKLKWKTKTKILVVPLGEKAGEKSLEIARKLREMEICTENDLMQRPISKNLEYASKRGIPFVALIGEKELKGGNLTLKNMETGKQETFSLKELEKVKKIVS